MTDQGSTDGGVESVGDSVDGADEIVGLGVNALAWEGDDVGGEVTPTTESNETVVFG